MLNIDKIDDNDEFELDLLDFQSCGRSKLQFKTMSLEHFWRTPQTDSFPILAKVTYHCVLLRRICESFSMLLNIKTKAINYLHLSDGT